jgi:uncharacterized protein YidB (DUF937 family)
MKRTLGKSLLTSSLAAALLIGGGAALLHTTAYADNTSGTAAQSSASGGASATAGKDHKVRAPFVKKGIVPGDVLKEAASLLGTDEKTLLQDLRGGKTLAQIAQDSKGWNEDTLVQKLSDAIGQKLDEQVKNGKLTQDKADQVKAKLTDRVKQAVEGKFPFPGGRGNEHGFGFGFGGGAAATKDLASFLNLSEDDLKAKLKDGQSLAAIAQAQGVSEDQLIAHIKDGLTNKIKSFVEHARKAKPEQAPNSQAPAASSSAQ